MQEGLLLAKDFPYLPHIIPDVNIIVTANYDAFGNIESRNYTWDGKGNGVVGVSFALIGMAEETEMNVTGNILTVGPYRLRIIGRDSYCQMLYAVRDNRRAVIKVKQVLLSSLLNRFYRRLIITLSVWGLADYHAATYPVWRDVHVLRWCADRVTMVKRRVSDLLGGVLWNIR